MSEMVERVARALAKEEGYAYDSVPYDARARAAIEAMREPPESMANHPSYENGEWSRRNIEAFVDAALSR